MVDNGKPDKELTPSVRWVKPWMAVIFSLIVPGLGQMMVGQIRRGLMLLLSLVTTLGLLWWRMNLAARREVEPWDIFTKAIDIQPILGFLVLGILVLWLWIAWDAYVQARRVEEKKKPKGAISVFALVLAIFFFLGW